MFFEVSFETVKCLDKFVRQLIFVLLEILKKFECFCCGFHDPLRLAILGGGQAPIKTKLFER